MAKFATGLLLQTILLLVVPHATAFPAKLVSRADTEYDYVVIGGGPSGLVVAERLSENKDVSVLVIESGPLLEGKEESDELLVNPKFTNLGFGGAKFTWPNISSGPQEGLNGRYFLQVYGKIVGGGSALNGKIWARGSARDYDDWATYLGDDGWGWKSLIQYFKKSETFTPPKESYRAQGNVTWDMSVHGTNGPINATFPERYFPSTSNLIAAEKALGIPQKKDQADGDPIGSIWQPSSVDPKDYSRSYSRRGYYDPARGRPNLHLLPDNTVTKILFDGKTVVGVEYATEPGAERKSTKVNKEVLLAGGAIKSPQLLQVSGVGPKRLTDSIGVPSIVDLPVGENFQDHAGTTMNWNLTLDGEERLWQQKTNETWMEAEYAQYINNNTGYYTAQSNNHMVLLSLPMLFGNRSDALVARFTDTDAKQYLHADADSVTLEAYKRQLELTYAALKTNEVAVDENMGAGRINIVAKPLSRGFVFANTSNIWDSPNVNHRTFSHPLDLDTMVESVRFTRKLYSTPEMSPLSPAENAPGAAAQSDEQLIAWIRQTMGFGNAHGCCTAPMGTVLDSKLRVKGVQGLRVVDSSSWPIIPGAHTTQCTAYAVAERAADIIKESWL